MYKQTNDGIPTPTANLAINKSRLKVYGKKSDVPTYYLQKGQEFQIELYNPTKDTILAKISLNGKPIAQGGLVLKPAQRVFLDRYIDVARKFKFDTYEVANTSEARKAIEDNGDFKVEFYKEYTPVSYPHLWLNANNVYGSAGTNTGTSRGIGNYYNADIKFTTNSGGSNISGQSLGLTSLSDSVPVGASANLASMDTLDFMDQDLSRTSSPLRSRSMAKKSKKSIETGRVEMGSQSDQTLKTVYMNWETYPFHTVEYKMLPQSQKVNTVADISVKRYCTNCGAKNKANFKFCPSCGTRI